MLNNTFVSESCQFPDIYLSQGNVAVRLRCGGLL